MRFVYYIVIILVLNSCSSFNKSAFRKDYKRLLYVKELKGKYYLSPFKKQGEKKLRLTSVDLFSLVTTQFWMQNDELSRLQYSENTYYVELNTKDNSVLYIKLFENDKLIREEVIGGKLKNGMFYLDNKYRKCNGIPYVFGGCQKNKRRIGISKKGQLIVNTSFKNGGAILFMLAAGGSYNSSYLFNRI